MARPASSSWTARPSRSSAAGRSTAARRTCTTTSGGTCRATTWCRANGACRRSSRTASSPEDLLVEQIRPPHPFLGPARAPQCADHRPRRQPPDGAGSAARARSGPRIRLPRRRGRHHQPRRLDLDLVARGRQVPRREDRDDPARARAEGPAAAAAARALARCRRWSPTSTCRWTTSFSTSPAGAPARCVSTMSPTR